MRWMTPGAPVHAVSMRLGAFPTQEAEDRLEQGVVLARVGAVVVESLKRDELRAGNLVGGAPCLIKEVRVPGPMKIRHGMCQAERSSPIGPSAVAVVHAASRAAVSLASQRVRLGSGNRTFQNTSNARTRASMPSVRAATRLSVMTRVIGLSGHAYGCCPPITS